MTSVTLQSAVFLPPVTLSQSDAFHSTTGDINIEKSPHVNPLTLATTTFHPISKETLFCLIPLLQNEGGIKRFFHQILSIRYQAICRQVIITNDPDFWAASKLDRLLLKLFVHAEELEDIEEKASSALLQMLEKSGFVGENRVFDILDHLLCYNELIPNAWPLNMIYVYKDGLDASGNSSLAREFTKSFILQLQTKEFSFKTWDFKDYCNRLFNNDCIEYFRFKKALPFIYIAAPISCTFSKLPQHFTLPKDAVEDVDANELYYHVVAYELCKKEEKESSHPLAFLIRERSQWILYTSSSSVYKQYASMDDAKADYETCYDVVGVIAEHVEPSILESTLEAIPKILPIDTVDPKDIIRDIIDPEAEWDSFLLYFNDFISTFYTFPNAISTDLPEICELAADYFLHILSYLPYLELCIPQSKLYELLHQCFRCFLQEYFLELSGKEERWCFAALLNNKKVSSALKKYERFVRKRASSATFQNTFSKPSIIGTAENLAAKANAPIVFYDPPTSSSSCVREPDDPIELNNSLQDCSINSESQMILCSEELKVDLITLDISKQTEISLANCAEQFAEALCKSSKTYDLLHYYRKEELKKWLLKLLADIYSYKKIDISQERLDSLAYETLEVLYEWLYFTKAEKITLHSRLQALYLLNKKASLTHFLATLPHDNMRIEKELMIWYETIISPLLSRLKIPKMVSIEDLISFLRVDDEDD